MNKELLKDLLMYLDTQLNWEHDNFLNNNMIDSMQLIKFLTNKHPEFSNTKERHALIRGILEELEK